MQLPSKNIHCCERTYQHWVCPETPRQPPSAIQWKAIEQLPALPARPVWAPFDEPSWKRGFLVPHDLLWQPTACRLLLVIHQQAFEYAALAPPFQEELEYRYLVLVIHLYFFPVHSILFWPWHERADARAWVYWVWDHIQERRILHDLLGLHLDLPELLPFHVERQRIHCPRRRLER